MIPFFYSSLCKIMHFFSNSILNAKLCQLCGTFSRLFEILLKSLIIWHFMHHFPKFCKVKWNYAIPILYPFFIFFHINLCNFLFSMALKLSQFCILMKDCTELCSVTEARSTCTLSVEVK